MTRPSDTSRTHAALLRLLLLLFLFAVSQHGERVPGGLLWIEGHFCRDVQSVLLAPLEGHQRAPADHRCMNFIWVQSFPPPVRRAAGESSLRRTQCQECFQSCPEACRPGGIESSGAPSESACSATSFRSDVVSSSWASSSRQVACSMFSWMVGFCNMNGFLDDGFCLFCRSKLQTCRLHAELVPIPHNPLGSCPERGKVK